MSVKTIGVLFGMEDTFPWALCHEINELARRRGLSVKGEPVQIGHISQEQAFGYDVILDRISHEVPFYRTFLKCAAARGVQVVNSPFWWSADDKFFDNVVSPVFAGTNGIVYVLPETRSNSEIFALYYDVE